MTQSDVVLFGIAILISFCLLFASFVVASWVRRNAIGKSPYTGAPLRAGSDLSYYSAKKILEFLFNRQDYDNPIIDLKRSAYCRDTGRIFANCLTWYGTLDVDWNFIQKRFPGSFVSWGSLNRDQQLAVLKEHYSLEGFQTEKSSRFSAPKDIEPEFIFAKPGPLYVDFNTKILVGWQIVPDTEFEVLIVQRPKSKP